MATVIVLVILWANKVALKPVKWEPLPGETVRKEVKTEQGLIVGSKTGMKNKKKE